MNTPLVSPSPRRKVSRSVAGRFFTTTLLAWALSIVVLVPCWYVLLRQSLLHAEQDLHSRVAPMVAEELVRSGHDRSTVGPLFRWLTRANPALSTYLLDSNGQILEAADPESIGKVIPTDEIERSISPLWNPWLRCGPDPRERAGCLPFSATHVEIGDAQYLLYIGVTQGMVGALLHSRGALWVVAHFLPAIAVSFVIVLSLSVFGFRYVTRTLRDLAATLDRHESGDFSARCGSSSNDEIGVLARAFNTLADAVVLRNNERANAAQRQGHALRSIVHDFLRPVSVVTLLCDQSHHNRKPLEPSEWEARARASLEAEQSLLDQMSSDGMSAAALEDVSLQLVASECVANMAPLFERKGVALRLVCGGPESTVAGRHNELYRVVQNLIDNGLRYTPAGGTVTCSVHNTDGFSLLDVSDSGIGIPETELARLGHAFYRSPVAVSANPGGSGLGLNTVRSIVERHHGGVTIHSRLGIGTTVRCSFPRRGNPFPTPEWREVPHAGLPVPRESGILQTTSLRWQTLALILTASTLLGCAGCWLLPQKTVAPALVFVAMWSFATGLLLADSRVSPAPFGRRSALLLLPVACFLTIKQITLLWIMAVFALVSGYRVVKSASQGSYRPLSRRLATQLFFALYLSVVVDGLITGAYRDQILFGADSRDTHESLQDLADAVRGIGAEALSAATGVGMRERMFLVGLLNPHLELHLRGPNDEELGDSPFSSRSPDDPFRTDWRMVPGEQRDTQSIERLIDGFHAIIPLPELRGSRLFVSSESPSARLALRRTGEFYLLVYFLLSQAILLLLGAVVGFLMNRSLGSRVLAVTASVGEIEAGRPPVRVPPGENDEIDRIAVVLPKLAGSISRAAAATELLEMRTAMVVSATQASLQSRVVAARKLLEQGDCSITFDETRREFAALNASQGEVLNMVFDLSRIEQGALQFRITRFSLEDLLTEAILTVAATARSARVWNIAGATLEQTMTGDFSLLARAIVALLEAIPDGVVNEGSIQVDERTIEIYPTLEADLADRLFRRDKPTEQTLAWLFAEAVLVNHRCQLASSAGRIHIDLSQDQSAECVLSTLPSKIRECSGNEV